ARIRDVLIALGGSADEFDRAHDQAATEQASLGSRIEAYTRLVSHTTTWTAPAAPPIELELTPPPVVEAAGVAHPAHVAQRRPAPPIELELTPPPVVEAAGVAHPARVAHRRPAHRRRRGKIVSGVRRTAGAARAFARLLVHAVGAIVRLLLGAARAVALAPLHAVRLCARGAQALTALLVRAVRAAVRLLLGAARAVALAPLHAVRLCARAAQALT